MAYAFTQDVRSTPVFCERILEGLGHNFRPEPARNPLPVVHIWSQSGATLPNRTASIAD